MITQQPYDVDIQLTMPRTPTNLAAGNFMVDLQLLGPYNPLLQKPESFTSFMRNVTAPKESGLSVLHHSRRPAMLTYTSPIPFLAQTLLYLPFHLFKIRDLDSACLKIPMFERLSFPRGTSNIPTHVRLEIQSDSSANTGNTMPTFNIPFLGVGSASGGSGVSQEVRPRALQVYSSKISFCARFGGLRYVVYNYRVLSFVVFTTLFYVSAVVSMGLAWAGISAFLNKDRGGGVLVKREDGTVGGGGKGKRKAEGDLDDSSAQTQTQARIKQEQEEDVSTSGGLSPSNLSDSPASFPTGSRQPPLQYPGRSQHGNVAAAQERLRLGEVADDEEGGEAGQMESVWERQARERDSGRGGDSGLGTSLESEGPPGIVRRRSGRGSGSGSRDRGL